VSFEQAFRFEVWDGNLVFLRETETEADLAGLEEVGTVAGRAHFQVYLDQQSHRALVFSSAGEQLADLSVAVGKPLLQPTIRLLNKRGDVRLERLRIGRWDGQPPREVRADKSRIHLADGSIVYGELAGFEAAAGEFIVRSDDTETRLPVDDVGSIVLSSPAGVQPRQIRAVFQDGVRLSGELMKVDGERVWLNCPSVAEPLRLPIAELHTLMVLVGERTRPSADGRVGRLEADGVKLSGCLVDGRRESGASCFVWRPLGSATASALCEGCPARVVYRESVSRYPRTAVATTPVAPPQQVGGLLGQLAQALAGASSSPPTRVASRPSSRYDPCLYLRTGDTIPCSVERIDEKGVSFRSSVFDATFVTHDKIKAVELENRSRGIRINRSKRDRLLTLPRMQRNNPPTHLIRSTSGDYLRARLNEMDDETLTVEVRLETRQLPRRYVSQIIWLHDGELEATDKPTTSSAAATRVQALRDDGIRLTFYPEELIDSNLCGTSEVLGPCRVALSEVDQLLIGGAIEEAAPSLAYQRWRLHPAVDPKFVEGDGGSAARAPGTESALVGKPAPDFKLNLLDGESFRLSDHQGSVVVLDFWATWCGPCIQAMPEVDRVVNEFREQNVMLIAVNLQDTTDAIAATLERIGLDTAVALDRDGVVAEKYTVTAIPQTVIVDGEGKIARLFVGGGAQLADQLREALASVLADGD
jgi:thiol-disulfide isomerase/thioredoxin